MPANENIFAYTEHGQGITSNYPAFVSLNTHQEEGKVALSVRARGNLGKDHGSIVMTDEELLQFTGAALKYLQTSKHLK